MPSVFVLVCAFVCVYLFRSGDGNSILEYCYERKVQIP